MKLMQRVKIANSFLQSVSNGFHVIILSLPMQFYKRLSKNFLKQQYKHSLKFTEAFIGNRQGDICENRRTTDSCLLLGCHQKKARS